MHLTQSYVRSLSLAEQAQHYFKAQQSDGWYITRQSAWHNNWRAALDSWIYHLPYV